MKYVKAGHGSIFLLLSKHLRGGGKNQESVLTTSQVQSQPGQLESFKKQTNKQCCKSLFLTVSVLELNLPIYLLHCYQLNNFPDSLLLSLPALGNLYSTSYFFFFSFTQVPLASLKLSMYPRLASNLWQPSCVSITGEATIPRFYPQLHQSRFFVCLFWFFDTGF